MGPTATKSASEVMVNMVNKVKVKGVVYGLGRGLTPTRNNMTTTTIRTRAASLSSSSSRSRSRARCTRCRSALEARRSCQSSASSASSSSANTPPAGLRFPLAPRKQRRTRTTRTRVAEEVVGPLADAWSVGTNGLPSQFAGIETQLFQASLLPELLYLWFLSRPEAKTPPLANVGSRMLLLFVFATIPAGIIAKAQFGDVLANVDVLHGTSESLLTFSNLVVALGFWAWAGSFSARTAASTHLAKQNQLVDLDSASSSSRHKQVRVGLHLRSCWRRSARGVRWL